MGAPLGSKRVQCDDAETIFCGGFKPANHMVGLVDSSEVDLVPIRASQSFEPVTEVPYAGATIGQNIRPAQVH